MNILSRLKSNLQKFENIRQKDFAHLDTQHQTYLDFTGGGLMAQSHLQKHYELLSKNVFGNPHSINPTSSFSTELVEETRRAILTFFNASDDYLCIFTANASGALRIVGDCYPFDENSLLVLSKDNHNSVLGISEKATLKGAKTHFVHVDREMRLIENEMFQALEMNNEYARKLLAYPAQSNYSGVQHSLSWVKLAQQKGFDVLLDVAAYVPTNPLDLQQIAPDFACISFYKMFGYPTGIGCLLVKKNTYQRLQKVSYAGGTVKIASTIPKGFLLQDNHERFEEGTISYTQIPAVKMGLDYLQYIGLEDIQRKVKKTTASFLNILQNTRHANGQRMVQIIGPANTEERGGTIAFYLKDIHGKRIPLEQIEIEAAHLGISLRTGCFCNPGADECYYDLNEEEVLQLIRHVESNQKKYIDKYKAQRGAVRISVGMVTNDKDLSVFVMLLDKFINQSLLEGIHTKFETLLID